MYTVVERNDLKVTLWAKGVKEIKWKDSALWNLLKHICFCMSSDAEVCVYLCSSGSDPDLQQDSHHPLDEGHRAAV